MSANFCLNAVASSVQLGKSGNGIKSTITGVETRNAADSALVTMAVATPTLDAEAATKKYVDDLVSLSVTWKEAVLVCSTVNININAPGAAIDGVTMAPLDRVVLTGQSTSGTENGLWLWNGSAIAMTRPDDWAVGSEQSGSVVSVREGTCADSIYIASADPAVVDTDDPLMLLIGTTAAGVTSVTDAVAVPAGGVSLLAASGTGAVTVNVLDDSPRISVALAAGIITPDIVAASIGTTQLTDQGVTGAKLASNASLMRETFTVVFGDQGTTVAGPTLLPNSRIHSTDVDVTTAFDDVNATIDVQVNATSVQGPVFSDPTITDVYQCTGLNDENVAAVAISAVVGGSTSTTGAARINVYYYVTS